MLKTNNTVISIITIFVKPLGTSIFNILAILETVNPFLTFPPKDTEVGNKLNFIDD